MPIKINSTDIFVVGDYEIQARFSDNEYSANDILTNTSAPSQIASNSSYLGNSTIQNTNSNSSNLIPDDDFLLEDSSIMNNSFVEPEENNYQSNVMDMFKEDEAQDSYNEFSGLSKVEPTIIQEDFYTDTVSNETLHEHINIPQFTQEILQEDFIKEEPLQKAKKHSIIPDDDEEEMEEIIETSFEQSTQENKEEAIVIKEEPIEKVKHLGENEGNETIYLLEKKLGIQLTSLSKESRDLIITEIADLAINCLEGLKNSLDLKDKIKKDLQIKNLNPAQDDANPIKMGQYALNLLDYKNSEKGIKLSDAVKKSFSELDTHNVALHRSSKNLINIAVTKFSPKSLEHHFETNGQLTALMPKKYQMWDAYIDMFNKLNEDPDFGVNLIAKDFSNEYNNISYTIKLTSI